MLGCSFESCQDSRLGGSNSLFIIKETTRNSIAEAIIATNSQFYHLTNLLPNNAMRYATSCFAPSKQSIRASYMVSSSAELDRLRYAVQAIPIVLTKGIWNLSGIILKFKICTAGQRM